MKRLVVAVFLLASSAAAALLVSPEKPSDAPVYVGAPSDQKDSALAVGGGVALTAWTDSRGGVYAARTDLTTHALLDLGGIRLSPGTRPAVAFDGTNFLVVFQASSTTDRYYDIVGVRVSPSGQVLDLSARVISGAAKSQTNASVAFTNGAYLVAWQDGRSGGTTDDLIMGARVLPDGTLQDPNGIVIAQAANSRGLPSVTAGAGNFFVAWGDGRTSGNSRIMGTRVTPAGVVLDTQGITISRAGASAWEPAAAFDGTRYWVAFREYSSAIVTARLETDGTVIDANGIQIYSQYVGDQRPNIACGGGQCVVAWTRDNIGDSVYFARLSSGGTLLTDRFSPGYLGSTPYFSSGFYPPGLAFDGTQFLASWPESYCFQGKTGCRQSDVYQRRIGLDGGFNDPAPLRLSSAANLQLMPAVAFNGTNHLVAWVDDRRDQYDIHAARFDSSGAILDPAGIAITQAADIQETPTVASLGTKFLVVWSDRRGANNYDIFATRVGEDGAVLDPSGLPISTASGDQKEPVVASDGTGWLVAWTDSRGGSSSDIYGARVSSTGQVLDPGGLPLAAGSNTEYSPGLSFDGTQYLLAWAGSSRWTIDYGVFASRLSTDGKVLDTPALRLADAYTDGEPVVASSQGRFLVAWRSTNVGSPGRILASPVPRLDGGALQVLSPGVAGNPAYSGQPALASDGTNILAVWEEGRVVYGADAPIMGRHVGSDGRLLDAAPFQVTTVPPPLGSGRVALALASSGGQKFLLAHTRFGEAPLGNTRVVVRTLSGLAKGQPCGGNYQCESGFCVDGVCCDGACGGNNIGDCQTCSKATGALADGTCGPAAKDTRCRAAASACDAPEVCDGASISCPADGFAADGTPCDDRSACTRSDSCAAGACKGSNPVVCQASDPCHAAGTCDPTTGACSNPNQADGTSCDDKNPCTKTDACLVGVCKGANPMTCSAMDDCHSAGTCDPTTGTCSNPTQPDGTACSDGSYCTRRDTCLAGKCEGGSPITCTAIDLCHDAGACDPATGYCSTPQKADGTACDDRNPCTRTDACQAGVCKGGNPVTCEPSDGCHWAGACNPRTGLCSGEAAKVDGTPCDDKNACTRSDACRAGACRGTAFVSCSAWDACHAVGVCDPLTGRCSNPVRPDGTTCDDKNSCTVGDSCRAGVCTGSAPGCPTPGECQEPATCGGAGPCTFKSRSDGTLCSLGVCQDGACVVHSGEDAGRAPPAPDAGRASGDDAGSAEGTPTPSGCGCRAAGSVTGLFMLPAVLALRKRRRR